MYTLLMIFVTLVPLFLYLVFYKRRYKKGDGVLLIGVLLSIHILGALFTQGLHAFTQSIVVMFHCVAVAIFVYYIYKNRVMQVDERVSLSWKEVVAVLSLAIISSLLIGMVHFNYTGLVSTIAGNEYVVAESYTYPTFSDEWVAVHVAQETAVNNRLPTHDVFFGKPDFNFLFVFHSTISYIGVLYDVDLLTHYHHITLIISVLSIVLLYTVLRAIGVPVWAALVTGLLIPYTTTGSNLPGLWYLLPWNMSFVFLLATLTEFLHGYHRRGVLWAVVALVLYPPMVVFVLPILLIVGWKYMRRKHYYYTVLAMIVLLLLAYVLKNEWGVLEKGFSQVIRSLNNRHGVSPQMIIWEILPYGLVTFPLFLFGIYMLVKKKVFTIVLPIAVGVVLWILYALSVPTIVIDYYRVVMITTLLSMIPVGYGLPCVMEKVCKRFDHSKLPQHLLLTIFCIIIGMSVLGVVTYTERDVWQRLHTHIGLPLREGRYTIDPLPPVNHYLHDDDIRIFAPYSGQTFLAPPWKSLVLAVVTDNVPVITKPATFTVHGVVHDYFMGADCDTKTTLARKHNISLVYGMQISCQNFSKKAVSSEGLILYEFQE